MGSAGNTPTNTDAIDEFAGLSFSTVMQSFLIPTDSSTTEARLEEAVATASDLIERVYAAYRARTSSVAEVETQLQREREARMELELQLQREERASKRTSAASDSGFESDVDSIISRGTPTLTADEAIDQTTATVRESWSSAKPGVWGFFKARQQQLLLQQQQQQRLGDVEAVRAENRWLRERVREMEKAVDSALDAVAGRL